MSTALISTQTHVETPYIQVDIGGFTFGSIKKGGKNTSAGVQTNVSFPNFVTSLNVTKVNGAVNTYTITLNYAITPADDPNMIDKILGTISNSRELTLSYGDWSSPQFVYKQEKAIITKVSQNIDFKASKITYTIKCTSTALQLNSVKRYFPAKTAKPSSEIIALLKDESTGLLSIFGGMRDIDKVLKNNLIQSDDREVQLDAQESMSVLDYIAYLVSCMVATSETDDAIRDSVYYWAVYDDISNLYGGQYFMVRKVDNHPKYKVSYNTYEVDIGYPSGSFITNFTIKSEDSWAILYNYSKKIQQPETVYTIDDDGNITEHYSPSIIRATDGSATIGESDKTWWTNMTQFPLSATLTIKGLLRPAMLMSYVKVNAYFYGHKHTSSGLYIITKQEDTIDSSGYRTTLSLTRLSGDEEYA